MTQGYQPPPPPNYAPPGFPAAAPAPQYPPQYPPQYAAPQAPPAAPAYPPQYAPQAPAPMPPPAWAGQPAPQAPAYSPQGPPAQAQGWRAPAAGGGFGGVAAAKVFTKTPNFPGGVDAVVSLNELKPITSQNPQSLGQTMLVVECTIVQSPTLPPGATHAQVINVGKYGASDVKQVIGSLFGADPGRTDQLDRLATVEAFDACARQVGLDPNTVPMEARVGGAFSVAILTHVTGPAQPFRGRQLRLQTYVKATRPKFQGGPPGEFTMHNWRPVQGA